MALEPKNNTEVIRIFGDIHLPKGVTEDQFNKAFLSFLSDQHWSFHGSTMYYPDVDKIEDPDKKAKEIKRQQNDIQNNMSILKERDEKKNHQMRSIDKPLSPPQKKQFLDTEED